MSLKMLSNQTSKVRIIWSTWTPRTSGRCTSASSRENAASARSARRSSLGGAVDLLVLHHVGQQPSPRRTRPTSTTSRAAEHRRRLRQLVGDPPGVVRLARLPVQRLQLTAALGDLGQRRGPLGVVLGEPGLLGRDGLLVLRLDVAELGQPALQRGAVPRDRVATGLRLGHRVAGGLPLRALPVEVGGVRALQHRPRLGGRERLQLLDVGGLHLETLAELDHSALEVVQVRHGALEPLPELGVLEPCGRGPLELVLYLVRVGHALTLGGGAPHEALFRHPAAVAGRPAPRGAVARVQRTFSRGCLPSKIRAHAEPDEVRHPERRVDGRDHGRDGPGGRTDRPADRPGARDPRPDPFLRCSRGGELRRPARGARRRPRPARAERRRQDHADPDAVDRAALRCRELPGRRRPAHRPCADPARRGGAAGERGLPARPDLRGVADAARPALRRPAPRRPRARRPAARRGRSGGPASVPDRRAEPRHAAAAGHRPGPGERPRGRVPGRAHPGARPVRPAAGAGARHPHRPRARRHRRAQHARPRRGRADLRPGGHLEPWPGRRGRDDGRGGTPGSRPREGRLEVPADHRARALDTLAAHHVPAEPGANGHRGVVRLELPGDVAPEDSSAAALRCLLDAGVPVLGFSVEGGRLSDAFLRVTRGDGDE